MITTPTLDEILQDLRSFLTDREPALSVSLDTDEGAMLASIAQAIYGLLYNAYEVQNDVFPQDAGEEALLKHAEVRLGVNPRRGATSSAVTNGLRVYGTETYSASAGSLLRHTDGTEYQLDEAALIPAAGYVDVTVTSIDKGSNVNKSAGETLTFVSPPTGIAADAVLQSDMEGGLDLETIEELRVRLLHAYANPPAGGKASDYWQWAMEVDGVIAAYVYCPHSLDPDCRRGVGTVDVCFTTGGTGSNRIPTATQVAEVQEKLDDERPCACKDVLAIAPTADTENVVIEIDALEAGYDWDWDDTATSYSVNSYSAADLRITWNTTLPDSLKNAVDAGLTPRIFCNGEIMEVREYGNGGGNDTDLVAAPAATPTGSIDAAGPFSVTALADIKTYMDGLGPAKGTAADPNQAWDDTLRTAKLYDVTMSVAGVQDCSVITPSSNVVPTDTGSVINLIVYNTITIRRG